MSKYEIWQLKPGNAKLLFMYKGWLEANNIKLDWNNYRRVYAGKAKPGKYALDRIYEKLNQPQKPEGYTGHSLSVGDLIVMDSRVYFVNSLGFVDVTEEIGGQDNG